MNDHTKDRHAALAEVIQFQARNELHRAFAPDPEPARERMTVLQAVGVALVFILSACIVLTLLGWGWQELSQVDWSALAQIGGRLL